MKIVEVFRLEDWGFPFPNGFPNLAIKGAIFIGSHTPVATSMSKTMPKGRVLGVMARKGGENNAKNGGKPRNVMCHGTCQNLGIHV